ncbi:MAG TPA: ribonuclease catalytic domain-containing protein, partial [Micavibrio sp.]
MRLEDPSLDSVIEQRLYQFIAMSPHPIGRQAIINAFDDLAADQLAAALDDLQAAQKIKEDGKGYVADKPWADIAYAVVGAFDMNGRGPVPLNLENMSPDAGLKVSLTRQSAYKHNLNQGDRIVVGLVRSANDPHKLNARFIEKLEPGRNYFMPGVYNYDAHLFTPLNRSVKSSFTLASAPVAAELSRQFLVEMPASFDLRDPVIQVADAQGFDVVSGDAVSWIVTSKHGIHQSHARHILKDAARINRRKLAIEGRTDLRHLDFVTVDPLGSTDLDDGFVAEMHDEGYHLYTAIADVPAHVLYNSAVDRAAYARGVTYYLKDYTAHMLPPVLSTRKCSLLPHEDRLALVVRQNLDWDCSLKSYDVMAAVIRSRAQLTYGQFYDFLEQDDPRFRVIAMIHDTRRRRGMNADIAPFLKEDPGQYATKSIIETLMVQTNVLLAKYLKDTDTPFLARNFEADAGGRNNVGRAQYSAKAKGHAQIGMLYAHFTSPIRRYSDIFNIRAAHKVLGNQAYALSAAEIDLQEQIAAHLNERRRVERDVQHDIQKFHAMRDLGRLQQTPIR